MQKWWIYQSNQLKAYSVVAEWRGPQCCWEIEAGREVILDLPEVCYPWKALAAIQASFPRSHPMSSLTGESGSKNSCQKGFNVIDKPFVSTEAPQLASPNKTTQNLRIGGKTCWAACGIKQQEVSVSVTVTVDFYKWLCKPWRKSPEGLEVVVLIPSPPHAPSSPCQQPLQLLSHLQLSSAELAFPIFSPFFFFFCLCIWKDISLSSFRPLHFKHASWTAGEREVFSSPLPVPRLQGTGQAARAQLEGGLVPSLDSCQEFHSSSRPDGLRFESHS